jgi:hypothetical protein
MGQELTCSLCCGKRRIKGKALLETAEIIFRASNRSFRLRTAFAEIKSIKAVDGELRIQGSGDLAIFELGAKAEKWCEKILHPKSRFEKLGVKPGANVSLVGEFDKQFISEITRAQKTLQKVSRVRNPIAYFSLLNRRRTSNGFLVWSKTFVTLQLFGLFIRRGKSTSRKTMYFRWDGKPD